MLWLLFLAAIILLVILGFLAEEFFNLLFRGYAPVVNSASQSLDIAVDQFNQLQLPAGAKIYELGCGQAGFLRRLEKSAKNKYTLIGVELISSIYWLAKIQLSLAKSRINLQRRDFLKMNLAQGDCFYCYLNQAAMVKLALKLKAEAKPGAYLISNQFYLPGYEPISEKEISVGKAVRVYKI